MNSWIATHQDVVSHRMMKKRCKEIILRVFYVFLRVGVIYQL